MVYMWIYKFVFNTQPSHPIFLTNVYSYSYVVHVCSRWKRRPRKYSWTIWPARAERFPWKIWCDKTHNLVTRSDTEACSWGYHTHHSESLSEMQALSSLTYTQDVGLQFTHLHPYRSQRWTRNQPSFIWTRTSWLMWSSWKSRSSREHWPIRTARSFRYIVFIHSILFKTKDAALNVASWDLVTNTYEYTHSIYFSSDVYLDSCCVFYSINLFCLLGVHCRPARC